MPGTLFAQNNVKQIKGRILNNSQAPLPNVSVLLINKADSSQKVNITNSLGEYTFSNVNTGQYSIQITAIGFKKTTIDSIAVSEERPVIIIPDILLGSDFKALNSVTVSAKAPPVQILSDRIVLNVASNISGTGSNAFDYLKTAPGVIVKNESDVMVNGKSGLSLYVDGKSSNLSGEEIITYLKTLSTSMIESINIITNPSAKYDASGGAGIIEIKLKKNNNFGFNGNIGLNANYTDYQPKYDAILNANYRNKKINIYGIGGYYTGNTIMTINYNRKQADYNGIVNSYNQVFNNYTDKQTTNIKIGADYTISAKHTLGLLLNTNFNDQNSVGESQTNIFRQEGKLDSQLRAINRQPQAVNRFDYNLNYRFADQKKNELNIDLNYGNFDLDANSTLNNQYLDGTGSPTRELDYKNNSSTEIILKSFKIDYIRKLKNGVLSFGGKLSLVNSDNKLKFYNIINGTDVLNTLQTNNYEYKEITNAVYTDYNATYKKWTYRLGLRLEDSKNSADLKPLSGNPQTIKNDYLNLFPNLLISYNIDKINSIAFLWNSRIDRPNYRTLNPFLFVLDELAYEKGNPFLKPQFTNELKLTYSYKQLFNASFSYSSIKDHIFFYRDTLGSSKTFESRINIPHKRIFSLSLFTYQTITPWWNLYGNLIGSYSTIKGPVNNTFLNASRFSWNLSGTQIFKIYKKWDMEISGIYNSKFLDAPAIVKAQWAINWGIQRSLLKDAAKLKLSVSDIFNAYEFSLVRDFGGLYYENVNKWESRQLKISFSYRFGNKNAKGPKIRETGVEEENKRIK
jgi:hypothetical protein